MERDLYKIPERLKLIAAKADEGESYKSLCSSPRHPVKQKIHLKRQKKEKRISGL